MLCICERAKALQGTRLCATCTNFYCPCGCGFGKDTVKIFSSNIEQQKEKYVSFWMSNASYSKTAMKGFSNFIKNHFPQYNNIVGKYMILM
jgi:hypothetical protein